jgi:hypothetical protein
MYDILHSKLQNKNPYTTKMDIPIRTSTHVQYNNLFNVFTATIKAIPSTTHFTSRLVRQSGFNASWLNWYLTLDFYFVYGVRWIFKLLYGLMMDYRNSQNKYMSFLKIHMLCMTVTVTVPVYRLHGMNNIKTVLVDGASHELNC